MDKSNASKNLILADANSTSTSVRCRFRPQNARESNTRCLKALKPPQITYLGPDGHENIFNFDMVYGESVKQSEVFADVTYIVDGVLEGCNGTVLAYGQTGSGKTHTLIGQIEDPDLQGLVPRALNYLSQGMASMSRDPEVEFSVHMSVVEIYCEKIRDLLDPSRDNLPVKQDAARGVYIDGATEISVTDEQQLVVFMQEGLRQRSVCATSMNAESSRSHCIVNVMVEKTCSDGTVKQGKLCMVDLAGSERQSKTGTAGVSLAEGCQINKSLSCLANVIQALTDDKGRPHVPYRDSKLTRVLQDSLGGNARTVLIICCSPCMDNAAETLSTLRFGSRAKGVSNKVQVNQRMSAERLALQLEISKARIRELEAELAQMRASAALPAAASCATRDAAMQTHVAWELAAGDVAWELVAGNAACELVDDASQTTWADSGASGDRQVGGPAAGLWAEVVTGERVNCVASVQAAATLGENRTAVPAVVRAPGAAAADSSEGHEGVGKEAFDGAALCGSSESGLRKEEVHDKSTQGSEVARAPPLLKSSPLGLITGPQNEGGWQDQKEAAPTSRQALIADCFALLAMLLGLAVYFVWEDARERQWTQACWQSSIV